MRLQDTVNSSSVPAQRANVARAIGARIAVVVCIVAAIFPWLSSGDHPLYAPDEGRYGSVGLHMAEGGSWLLPVYEGEIHLTKPPLTYWAIATAIRTVGKTELAVRAPSLLACTLAVGVLMFWGWSIRGPRVAALAVGTLSMMPLFIFVGRLATTDAMLNCFWLASLAFGWLAIERKQSRWAWLMWVMVAGGLMTKGPLALVPVALLVAWLGLARRWREVQNLRPLRGIVLAAVPILVWVTLVMTKHADAIDIWKHEVLSRATGGGSHPEPWWFYLPVFFFGLFPATVMLILPGLNVSWRRAWQEMRSDSPVALLVLAVVVPFIGFSLMAGKLPTYLLPMCAPLALLNALMLERWLDGSVAQTSVVRKMPDVRITMTIAAALVFTGMAVACAMYAPQLAIYLLPAGLFVAAPAWLTWNWNRQPERRAVGMLLVWAAWLVTMWGWFEIEDSLNAPRNPRTLMAQLHEIAGETVPTVFTYGFGDPTLSFYFDREIERLDMLPDGGASALASLHNVVLLVEERHFDTFTADHPEVAAQFERVGEWQRNLTQKTLILKPATHPS